MKTFNKVIIFTDTAECIAAISDMKNHDIRVSYAKGVFKGNEPKMYIYKETGILTVNIGDYVVLDNSEEVCVYTPDAWLEL